MASSSSFATVAAVEGRYLGLWGTPFSDGTKPVQAWGGVGSWPPPLFFVTTGGPEGQFENFDRILSNGTHTFNFFADSDGVWGPNDPQDFYGLTLAVEFVRFHPNETLSVLTMATVVANGSECVYNCPWGPLIWNAPAPSSVSFDGVTVAISEFRILASTNSAFDRVSYRDPEPNGKPDYYGTFKLSVSNIPVVPEPESYAMLIVGLGVLVFAIRRSKMSKT